MLLTRLLLERKNWRQNHPFGFVAKPSKNEDGTLNIMIWDCLIPGRKNTPWEGGLFNLRMTFKDDYPSNPPLCEFVPPLFHPNVSLSSGAICMPLFTHNWHPRLTVIDILEVIQIILGRPQSENILNEEAYIRYRRDKLQYNKIIKIQTKHMAPSC